MTTSVAADEDLARLGDRFTVTNRIWPVCETEGCNLDGQFKSSYTLQDTTYSGSHHHHMFFQQRVA